MTLQAVIKAIKREQSVVMNQAQQKVQQLEKAISALGEKQSRVQRKLSKAARRKISQAQKLRWSKVKAKLKG